MSDLFLYDQIQQLKQRISALETTVTAQGVMIMIKSEELAALSARLDTATNEIAADLADLRAKIADGTIAASDVAALDAQIARLELLGQDPTNPVP